MFQVASLLISVLSKQQDALEIVRLLSDPYEGQLPLESVTTLNFFDSEVKKCLIEMVMLLITK